MAGRNVLILYGPRYGSTEGISEKMTEILKKVAESDPKIDPSGWNDLRDWEQIEKFSLGFFDLLQA